MSSHEPQMTSAERLADFRKHKNDYFQNGGNSPLDPAQQPLFRQLAYFDYEPALRFETDIEPGANENTPISLDTSDGQQVGFLIAGIVRFLVGDGRYELTLLKDTERGRFFLPFADATNGLETYRWGRYLDPQLKPDGNLILDFNYAYNPYCAYSEGWSCPLPPDMNRLPMQIRAGERVFKLSDK